MIKEIKTKITVKSSPEIIWKTLTNFENYPNWNPFIKEIEGELKVSEQLKVKIQPENSSEMTFKPTILDLKKDKLFIWKGKFILKGLFDGEHKFELIDNKNGTTTFKQSEIFSGILVRIFNLESTKKGFEKMNQKIKEICELNTTANNV